MGFLGVITQFINFCSNFFKNVQKKHKKNKKEQKKKQKKNILNKHPKNQCIQYPFNVFSLIIIPSSILSHRFLFAHNLTPIFTEFWKILSNLVDLSFPLTIRYNCSFLAVYTLTPIYPILLHYIFTRLLHYWWKAINLKKEHFWYFPSNNIITLLNQYNLKLFGVNFELSPYFAPINAILRQLFTFCKLRFFFLF